MSEWLQLLIAAVTCLTGVTVAMAGHRIHRTNRRERDALRAAELEDREGDRDERMMTYLEREVTSLRIEVGRLWSALAGHRGREFIWQGVRHGDVLQIRALGAEPAPLPAVLLTLPDYLAPAEPASPEGH